MSEAAHPTITREQRFALHEWVIWFLRSRTEMLGEDITDHEDASTYREHLQEIEDGIALLNELGWAKDDPRETFPLTLPDDRLQRILIPMREAASLQLFHYRMVEHPSEEEEEHREAITIARAWGRINRHLVQKSIAKQARAREAGTDPP